MTLPSPAEMAAALIARDELPMPDKGDQGDRGEQGEKGDPGRNGTDGSKGDRGLIGPEGKTGPKGQKGDRGPKGDDGDEGPPGPPGKMGPAGTARGLFPRPGGGGSGSALTVKDEGATLSAAVSSIDFAGAGVTATNVGPAVTVTIPVSPASSLFDVLQVGGGAGALRITDLGDPLDPQDAVSKAYVDALEGQDIAVDPAVAGGSDVQAALEGLEATSATSPLVGATVDGGTGGSLEFEDAPGGGDGGAAAIRGGSGSGGGNGGSIEIYAGVGDAGASGGHVFIDAGPGDGGAINGAVLELFGGDEPFASGQVRLTAAEGLAGQDGSDVRLFGGGADGGANSGASIIAHGGEMVQGGQAELSGGDGGAGLPGGEVLLSGGTGDGGNDSAAAVRIGGGDGSGNAGLLEATSAGTAGAAAQFLGSDGSGGTVWTTPTVRTAAGAPSGAPTVGELPFAYDTTLVTGGFYYWNGSAWVKVATIL